MGGSISSTGNIQAGSVNARIGARSTTNTSSSYSLEGANSSGATHFIVSGDGKTLVTSGALVFAETFNVVGGSQFNGNITATGTSSASSFIGDGRQITNAVIALGTNATAYDLLSKTKARFTATYTATNTLTFSNATALEEFTMQLTNTNANVITFAGITLYFKTAGLPSGVSFAANALTFPADSAVKYNIVGIQFDGATFDCRIEIR